MRTTHRKQLIVAGILVAGLGVTGAATAKDGPREHREAASVAAVDSSPKSKDDIERQRGIVLEGSGVLGGLDVTTTVYENSLHGNSVQVVVGDPDGGQIGFAEQAQPFVVDGVLGATVEIDGQRAELTGTVVETGRSKRVTEPVHDAGERIVSKGTHTRLLVDVQLTFDGRSVDLEFAPAFAYDLEIHKVGPHGS